MARGGWLTRARRHRLAIGLIAAYALLLSQLLSAVTAVAADPIQDYLAAHLCGPSGDDAGHGAPGALGDHPHDCKLCGPGCGMGGCAPAAGLSGAGGLVSIARHADRIAFKAASNGAGLPVCALHPSDILSQGPPPAA